MGLPSTGVTAGVALGPDDPLDLHAATESGSVMCASDLG